MAKKLVFSGYRLLEWCLEKGESDASILEAFELWAADCEGKTKEEMWPYRTEPAWMEEVDG